MLFIVRAFENGNIYEYEYGNLKQAEEQYDWEESAELLLYTDGTETLIRRK